MQHKRKVDKNEKTFHQQLVDFYEHVSALIFHNSIVNNPYFLNVEQQAKTENLSRRASEKKEKSIAKGKTFVTLEITAVSRKMEKGKQSQKGFNQKKVIKYLPF